MEENKSGCFFSEHSVYMNFILPERAAKQSNRQ